MYINRLAHLFSPLFLILILAFSLSACNTTTKSSSSPPPKSSSTTTQAINTSIDQGKCPKEILAETLVCFTPRSLRQAYGVEQLTERGYTGKGQTVVVIVSYGSPTLQQDVNTFSNTFGLPAPNLHIYAPLGTISFNDPSYSDAKKKDIAGWVTETTLDVESIHAMAPEANIDVMTSPVSETEGLIGLPQFLQLEQYAVNHHLGNIISQSWGASEATLSDPASKTFLNTFSNFYQTATKTAGITFLSGSGDEGATDYSDLNATMYANQPTTSFPADDPWVTSVGGTQLMQTSNNNYVENAWSGSGGGSSKIFTEPSFQKVLPPAMQSQLNGGRGVPDVAADGNPDTAMADYVQGSWQQIGGTSASTPIWAGIIAVANQMAGHPLGYINPGIYTIGADTGSYSKDFRDITSGNNSQNQGGPNQAGANFSVRGFSAGLGWDKITGWGAPQADQFIPDLINSLKP